MPALPEPPLTSGPNAPAERRGLRQGPGGLQCEQALSMLGDNLELFVQIGRAYLVEIAALSPNIAALLDSNQLADAARMFHTIKGLSLTVGAVNLAALCTRLEKQVTGLHPSGSAQDAHLRSVLLGELHREVEATHNALSALIARWQPHTPAVQPLPEQTGDRAALVADLRVLRALLAQSDLHALEVHTALRKRHIFATDRLHDLQASLLVFDFSKAVVQCGELICEFDVQK